ncbi:MAG: hypothetical protein V3R99_06980 [Thermoguttaceae bacterium]
MNERELKRLLFEADRDAEPALPPDGRLGSRIRQLDRRRRRRQGVALAAVGLIVGGGLALGSLWRPLVPDAPIRNEIAHDAPPQVDIAQARAELAELQAKIARQEAELAALVAIEKRARLNRRTLAARQKVAIGSDFQSDFQREVDRTALTLLVAADWKVERYEMIDSARSDYEHVVKKFSQTEWADVARQRLVALQN